MSTIAILILTFMTILDPAVEAGSFYTSASNKIYYVEPLYNYKWFDAHMECHSKNMSLFTIESEDSFYDLYNILISGKFLKKPPHLWVGAVGAQRKFTWIATGKPVIWKFNNFDNSGNAENCLQFFENAKDIYDRNCMLALGFVCEENKYLAQGERRMLADKHITLNINQHTSSSDVK